jgi:vacuolar-type H+-ATPase subunit F/Vma7
MTMGGVAVIGEQERVLGWALAGVQVLAARDAEEVRAAWRALERGMQVVILSPAAAEVLTDELAKSPWPLPVVMPL